MNASTVSENTLTSKLRPVCQPEGICLKNHAASPPYGGETLHHLLGRSMYQRTAPRMISGASPEISSCIVVPRLPILN